MIPVVPVDTVTLDKALWFPAILCCVTVVHDLLSRLSFPLPLQRLHRTICSPFRNFLSLDDLGDQLHWKVTRSALQTGGLAGLAFLNCVGWLGYFTYATVLRDTAYIRGGSLATGITWVRLALPSNNQLKHQSETRVTRHSGSLSNHL